MPLLFPVSSIGCSVPSATGKVDWGESEREGEPPHRTESLVFQEVQTGLGIMEQSLYHRNGSQLTLGLPLGNSLGPRAVTPGKA